MSNDSRFTRSEVIRYTLRLLARALQRLLPRVPVGYEDASGFHYGAEPASARTSRATRRTAQA